MFAVLYVRGQQTQLIFGKGSGIDSVIAAAGAVDVGTELGIGDYGELTAEAMLQAEPDVILDEHHRSRNRSAGWPV